jgi:nucleoside-diphosphate-sugar epimerase
MLKVAVTGASGYIATRLIETLLADDRIERVVGFDVRPPEILSDRFVFDNVDVRTPSLEARLAGVDVLVHLAFIMDPIADENEMRDVNVNGTQNVLRAAGKAGIRKVVYTSSATVYGAHPDNPIPLTEESPLRANLDFSYPAHKLEAEYVVREFKEEYPNSIVTVFRPAIVFGPHVDNAWSHLMEFPVFFGVQGHRPPFQFVHEEDVAGALSWAVHNDLDGPYNLAPDGWLEADEVLAILGRRRVELPEPVAFSVLERLWTMGLAEAPAGMLHYVMYPWVVSGDKLKQAGFTCRHSTFETFREVADKVKGRIRVGNRSLRRDQLVAGAAAAGLLGAIFATRRARRRWAA